MSMEKISSPGGRRYILDDWPRCADGSEWDGSDLLALLVRGRNPFGDALDVRSLIYEFEYYLADDIVDVPIVTYGANHFGFELKLRGGRHIIARLSRGDMSKPGFDSGAMEKQIMHDHFELDTYDVLYPLGAPFSRGPLYHRDPKMSDEHVLTPNQGRRLFLFEKAEGEPYHYGRWRALNEQQKVWERIFGGVIRTYPIPVGPSREFCIALLKAKIEDTVGRRSALVDSEKGYHLLSPALESARKALLRLVPQILPRSSRHLGESTLYRFVLDHGDLGMHNMTVSNDEQGQPQITSVFDWEGGSIVPAILSEPKMVTTVDLVIDEKGQPSISRWGDGDSPEKMAQYRKWAAEYYKALFAEAPEYECIIKAGLDARRIWFGLRDYRGRDPEAHFVNLGAWAEKREEELNVEKEVSWTSRLLCGFHAI